MLGVAALAEVFLVLTALGKLIAPGAAAGALRQAGLRVPQSVVRLGATAELVVGVGALASGGAAFSALVALCYLAFAGFIVLALRRPGTVSSCGCFGALGRGGRDTPPTLGHLVLNLAAATVAFMAMAWPTPGVVTGLRQQPLSGIPLLGLVALGCYVAWIVLAVAPRTTAAVAAAETGRAPRERG